MLQHEADLAMQRRLVLKDFVLGKVRAVHWEDAAEG